MYTAEDLMIRARVSLLDRFSFFGHLAMNLNLKEDNNLPTAYTNGKVIGYNKEFIEKLAKENESFISFVVAHEVLHVVYDHMDISRRNGRHPRGWNIAADYVINLILKENSFTIPSIALCDDRFKDMNTEEVYEILKDEAKERQKNKQDGDQQGEAAFWDDSEDSFDDHSMWGTDENGEGMSKEEAEALQEKWKSSVENAAKMAGDKLTGSLKRMIDNLLNPKINWKNVLRNCFTDETKGDYSWNRPNKRFFGQGVVLPSIEKTTCLEIAVAVDVSGSTYNDIPAFLSELKGIANMFDSYKIHISQFDTEVKEEAILTNDGEFDSYLTRIISGGGTDFICWWDWFQTNDKVKNAKAVVFFTDGYPCSEWISGPAPKNLFWLIKGSEMVPPVGTPLYYDKM